MRPVSLPIGRIPLREPPCPGRQVGEGVSPALDARVLHSCAKSKVQPEETSNEQGDVLTDRFDRALLYATYFPGGQVRKGTSTPHGAHLLAMAATVLR